MLISLHFALSRSSLDFNAGHLLHQNLDLTQARLRNSRECGGSLPSHSSICTYGGSVCTPAWTEEREPLGSPKFVEDTTAHGLCRQKRSSNTIPGDQLQGVRSTAGALGAAITSLCPTGRLALTPTQAVLKSYSSQRKHFQH